MTSGDSSRSLELLVKVSEQAPKENQRLQNYLSALHDSLLDDEKSQLEQEQVLSQFQDAYQKLTAPANRLAIFLQWLDAPEGSATSTDEPVIAADLAGSDQEKGRLALISLGDQEYVVQVDPKLPVEQLVTGARVKVNEAYAIIGVLPIGQTGSMIKVGDSLPDGRLKVGGETPGSDGRVILRGEALKDVTIHAGDEVRLDSSGKVAVEHVERQESKDYFLETIPNIPWEKVGGQQDAIRLIRDTIEQPLLYPEIFRKFDKKPIKGILLYGPPGCGKTLIGKATAHNLREEYSKRMGREVKEYFMAISGPKILNMWLGETERMVREIFRTAREKAKEGRLVFIFMDEAESVLRTRSSGRYLNISNTVVPQFCAELDGLQSLDNVVLMLTSNRPDYIDPAVLRPERIDRKVKIARPDRDATKQILGIYLHADLPLDPEVLSHNHGEVDCARKELVEKLTDYVWSKSREHEFLKVFLRNGSSETLYLKDMVSGALLKSVVDRAKDAAIKRAIQNPKGDAGISLDDLIKAAADEYKENEIFPKSDTMEDWLQLLDYAPENVASVKPIGRHRGEELARKSVI